LEQLSNQRRGREREADKEKNAVSHKGYPPDVGFVETINVPRDEFLPIPEIAP
jgi:hypothetical protein